MGTAERSFSVEEELWLLKTGGDLQTKTLLSITFAFIRWTQDTKTRRNPLMIRTMTMT